MKETLEVQLFGLVDDNDKFSGTILINGVQPDSLDELYHANIYLWELMAHISREFFNGEGLGFEFIYDDDRAILAEKHWENR